MENLTVRFAQPDDAEKILAFLNTVGGESDNLLFGKNEISFTIAQEQEFLQTIAQSVNSCMYVGYVGNELAATCCLQGYSRQRICHRGEISVAVRKADWGKGIGTAMMSAAIEFARNCGISVIELQVRADNTAAMALYKNLGFVQIGYFPKFFCIHNEYQDAVLMNLYL